MPEAQRGKVTAHRESHGQRVVGPGYTRPPLCNTCHLLFTRLGAL